MEQAKITRVEVINDVGMPGQTGRVYTFGPMEGIDVRISLQDEGRTLKVFIEHAAP